jgi:hypothetical protein
VCFQRDTVKICRLDELQPLKDVEFSSNKCIQLLIFGGAIVNNFVVCLIRSYGKEMCLNGGHEDVTLCCRG